jgi:hypothetical protein
MSIVVIVIFCFFIGLFRGGAETGEISPALASTKMRGGTRCHQLWADFPICGGHPTILSMAALPRRSRK